MNIFFKLDLWWRHRVNYANINNIMNTDICYLQMKKKIIEQLFTDLRLKGM